MRAPGCGGVLLSVLFANLLSIPGVCRAEVVITDFRLTLTGDYSEGVGRIKAAARWQASQAAGVIYYGLVTEGRTIAISSRGRLSATGYAAYWNCSYEQFQVLKEDYFSQPHTFSLDAVGDYGVGTRCFSYVYEPADILRIENRVAGFSDMQRGLLEINHHPDANEGPDVYDVAHSTMHLPVVAAVTSIHADPDSGAIRELALDARPKKSPSEIDVELRLESDSGAAIHFAKETGNELFLSLPRQYRGYDFRPGPLTLQQYDPLDPAVQYPLYDVRKVVVGCEGLMWMPPLKGDYPSGVPYAHFTLSFTRKASGDLGNDGRFNLRDFAVLAKDWRSRSRPTIADVGGAHGFGVPDGNVDGRDLAMFCGKWAGDSDGFESGGFDRLGWFGEGDTYWRVTSDERHSGAFCAQAGRIADSERSRLTIMIECRTGEVRFWRKVSSEARGDFLRFRAGSVVLGEWSGELDWEQVSFPVQAGKRTFSWEYSKNDGGWMGQDTAWIDLVSFPTGELQSGRM